MDNVCARCGKSYNWLVDNCSYIQELYDGGKSWYSIERQSYYRKDCEKLDLCLDCMKELIDWVEKFSGGDNDGCSTDN